ncbi:MAG TPA: 4-alpha-glucanotransferase [Actinopolymorphaceae bacterium]|nr:4-alpha-glucanotransferase [Actinopolymorphaceae bacterium]
MPDAWGIEATYVDATGTPRQVSHETVERLRSIIGTPQDGAGPLVVEAGDSPHTGPVEVVLEDGTSITTDDRLPADLPLGYHSVTDPTGSSRRLIVAPRRCFFPTGPNARAWGWAAQLYATRSPQSWGIGDLGDLARLARWSERHEAGFVLVNPLGAVAPAGPQQPSPYFPSSRRYRNPLYLRVEDVPGAELVPDIVGRAATAGRALNDRREIDRDAVWRIKREALEAIWQAGGGRDEFERWYASQPDSLRLFASWCVLAERHGPDWHDWPTDCQHPRGRGVARLVAADSSDPAAAGPSGPATAGTSDGAADRVGFHAWLQWLLDRQLTAAGRQLAVMQDLPIGFDPGGFDAWEWQDQLALDVAVGAPADEFNSLGQEWGIPPFIPWRLRAGGYQPFVETVRANIAAGGGLRVDHVMGLFRLWWIVRGSPPPDGAYVRYPAADLLSILALESQRAGAVVVGEDLGTVEGGVREVLADRDVLSYRLLWFEERDPAGWPAKAMAAVTTHDLPTVAGLWDGTDLETQKALGLQPNEASTVALRGRLAHAGGLGSDAKPGEAVMAAYRQLARAPAALLSATLDDAAVVSERPNIPGSDDQRSNWTLALPVTLDEIEAHPTAAGISDILAAAVRGPDEGPTTEPDDDA